MKPINWDEYNESPYLPFWLCDGETLELARYDDNLRIEIESQLRLMVEQYHLENVEGEQLDRIGKILSEPRNGNDDRLYRIYLMLRILLNTTNGTVNDVIKVIKYFYTSETVNITANYPAGISILHDGEGPDVDFNKIMAAVIPAGVAYDTKELFNFIENLTVGDELRLIVCNKNTETFGNPIKFNGLIKFDGKTLNSKVVTRGNFDGVHKFSGDLSFAGIGKIASLSQPMPPFKFSSGILEELFIEIPDNNLIDKTKLIENQFIGMRKHNFFNGVNKFDGTIKFNSKQLIPIG